MATMVDVELSTKVELFVSCRNLRDMDWTSKSDPFVEVSVMQGTHGAWRAGAIGAAFGCGRLGRAEQAEHEQQRRVASVSAPREPCCICFCGRAARAHVVPWLP